MRPVAGLFAILASASVAVAANVPAQEPAPQAAPPLPAAGQVPSPVLDPQRFGGPAPDDAYGAYQRGLYLTALNLARPRAEAGDAAAQTLVAEILARGLGVPRNEAEAALWYQRAAEQGAPEAQFQYALLLLDGRLVEKDEKQAYALLESAAAAGNRLAQFNFAQLLVREHPGPSGLARAITYYERAAAAGVADAQYAMAQIHANGAGGKSRDEAEARRWLELSARQNFDTAQLDLATWLVEGRGGPRDFKAGFQWMSRAASGGNVAAQNRLAKLYMQGLGTDPDSILAAAWYFVARRAGLKDPEMEDFLDGLTDEEQKQALARANRLR